MEYPQLVSIETTNCCNAKCAFCPNNILQRHKHHMADDLFEKIVEDCRAFPLKAIEPFLNGEPFVDPQILPRLELIRRRLPTAKLRLYTNGYALTPDKIDALIGMGIAHLYISLNTLDAGTYRSIMGLDLERTLENLYYLTDPVRRDRVAHRLTFRMTRLKDTPRSEQEAFRSFCRDRRVRCFIVGLFNYKDEIASDLPIPNYPCEHIVRVDILSNGIATLCCMDQEGKYAWGNAAEDSVLDLYNGPIARRYRTEHREGGRREIDPCDRCNLFWPSLSGMSPRTTLKFAIQAGCYFLRYRPGGIKNPC